MRSSKRLLRVIEKAAQDPQGFALVSRAGTQKETAGGFTLIELLVAMAVFSMLAVLLLTITSEASRVWQRAESQKARRQTARIVLETMSRDLEAAAFPLGTSNANSLQFVLNPSSLGTDLANRDAVFWQASTASDSPGMSDVGYFVQWKGTTSALCRYRVPLTNSDSILQDPTRVLNEAAITAHAGGLSDPDYQGLLAENVLGLWVTLFDRSGSTNGLMPSYDSRTTAARPASAELAIVLIDPRMARRITNASEITAGYSQTVESFVSSLPAPLREGVQIFKTRVELQNTR